VEPDRADVSLYVIFMKSFLITLKSLEHGTLQVPVRQGFGCNEPTAFGSTMESYAMLIYEI
jgi:hypothetical protein